MCGVVVYVSDLERAKCTNLSVCCLYECQWHPFIRLFDPYCIDKMDTSNFFYFVNLSGKNTSKVCPLSNLIIIKKKSIYIIYIND